MLNVPARLLPLLTDQPQSGEALGARLGVGRVTVNTLARRLVEDGVPVVTTRGGYALEPGTPAPGLVPPGGNPGAWRGPAGLPRIAGLRYDRGRLLLPGRVSPFAMWPRRP